METVSKERIAQILYSFGIIADEITESVGATVTLYEITPSLGTRIGAVRALKDEIAVGLRVPSVRIIAPTPRGTIGIEVPRAERPIIPVTDIFNSPAYRSTDMALPVALGMTTTNDLFMADLADMPHLLIAGATGQGKSVGLNVMLLSLINKKSPEELKLLLIDPKRVELNIYSRLKGSYLAAPIITETDEAIRALGMVCELMESRYAMLERAGVRNIREYNAISAARLPYVVVVIDEYGDLIMSAGRPVETLVCRIAQKARAVGIHMVISTQRPSATIVTGNIKANFPSRLAFRTVTGTDSRVILDQTGAEKLSGKGDFIFVSGADTTRAQCALATAADVVKACDCATANGMMLFKPSSESVFAEKKYRLSTAPVRNLEQHTRFIVGHFGCISNASSLYHWFGTECATAWRQLQELGIISPVQKWSGEKATVLVHDPDEVSRRIANAIILNNP